MDVRVAPAEGCIPPIRTAAIFLEVAMLRWAIGFLIIALIAAVLGFGGVAAAAASIAKIIFFIFLVLFVLSLLAHLFRSGPRL